VELSSFPGNVLRLNAVDRILWPTFPGTQWISLRPWFPLPDARKMSFLSSFLRPFLYRGMCRFVVSTLIIHPFLPSQGKMTSIRFWICTISSSSILP
jgi:hypothetical protein